MAGVVVYIGRRDESVERLRARVDDLRVRQLSTPPSDPEWPAAPAVGCVVCEQALPETSGLAVIDAITDVEPELPIVLHPQDGDEALAARATARGAAGYVPQPNPADDDQRTDAPGSDERAHAADADGQQPDAGSLPDLASTVAELVDAYRTVQTESRTIDHLPGVAYRSTAAPGWPIEYVGGNCEGLTGYPATALLEGEVTFEEDLIHPSDRERVRRRFDRQLEADDRFELTYRIVTASGETRWVWERGYRVDEDADPATLEGHIFDVTERTERQRELALLTEAMDRSSAGILISDPDREANPIVYANAGFVELTGYDRETVVGRTGRLLEGPDTDRETSERIDQAVEAGEQATVTVRHYRADGTRFWNRVRIIPIRDDDGWLTNFVWFMHDVTDEVEQNRRLQLLQRVLRHNLRNSMTHLLGGLELIERECDPTDVDLDSLQSTGRELAAISDRAREIERLLAGGREYECRDLETLLEGAAQRVAAGYPLAAIDVEQPPAVDVLVDGRIDAAIRELLANAIEHNDRPTPSVGIRSLGTHSREGIDVVRIAITDDGPTIPGADRTVLTEGEETQLHHGSGLGLWLVHWLVTVSGGSITHRTRDPRGNAVVLEFVVDE